MSKYTMVLAIGATLAISACSRPAPEPEPMPAPTVIMEPAASKGKY